MALMSVEQELITRQLQFGDLQAKASTAIVMGGGTGTYPIQTAEASRNFLTWYFENTAASGDNRGMYLRLYLSGGGGGDAARVFCTVESNSTGTAHGQHTSLNFGSSAGTVTGLGVASRNTLHIPNRAITIGTAAALQAEIYCDGTSAAATATSLGLIRAIVDGGDATARAKVKNFLVASIPTGSGNMFESSLTAGNVNAGCTCALRVEINGTTYWIPVATTLT